MSEKILYILQRFRNPRNRISDRYTMSEKILYLLQRFRNPRNRISDRYTMSEKILYLLQRFSNPRHRNCDRCTMAGTDSIYYRGTMYPPPSHLRRRIAKSGGDAMLAGPHQILALKYDFRYFSESLSKMNHFKKSYKAIVKYVLQKLLGFSSMMCVFLSLKRRDDPILYGTLCMPSLFSEPL